MAQPMSATNPFLNFPYGPIQMECEAHDLVVEGEVPADLCGTLFRAGPNQRFKPRGDYHLFMGDGMVHGVRLQGGRAHWYRNRWIRTTSLAEEIAAGHTLWKGLKEPPRRDRPDEPQKNNSNTDVKFHAGKLLTMFYLTGKPYHLDIHTLEMIITSLA